FAGDVAIARALQATPEPRDQEFVFALYDAAMSNTQRPASMPQTKATGRDVARWLEENSPEFRAAQKEREASAEALKKEREASAEAANKEREASAAAATQKAEEEKRKREAYTLRPDNNAWDQLARVFQPTDS